MIMSLATQTLMVGLLCSTPQDPAQTAAPVQDAPAPAASADEPRWQDLNGVVMIVNQDIITGRQLSKQMEEFERRNKPITNEVEARRARSLVLTDDVKRRLSEQAGQDMGIDPKLVERRVDENMERMQEDANGVTGLSKRFEAQKTSPDEVRHLIREHLYSGVWRESVTGEGGGPQARPFRDRYVRPGLLRFYYTNVVDRPEGAAAIGGKLAKYTLQLLVVDPDELGGREKARTIVQQLRKRLADGEEAGPILAEYSKRRENIETDEVAIQRTDKDLAAFVKSAQPGDLSEIITLKSESGKVYLQVWRLVERTAAFKPDLAAADTQEAITKSFRRDLEDYRLNAAYRQLLRSAFVWPPEYAGR